MVFATSGCVEPLDNNVRGFDPDAVYLPIRLYIPGVTPATKVSPSDINGLTGNTESQIHCVQVWMFTHGGLDTESALAYAEAGTLTGQTTNLPNGSGYYNQNYDPGENPANTLDWSKGYWENDYTYKLSMRIPKRILQGNNLKFDFYVLANAKSIGTTTLQAMTRGELKESMFGGGASDDFGTTSPVTEVGTNGLPISGFFNKGSNTETAANASGVDLSFLKEDKVFTPADFYANMPIVQLERAVSRIRFSFAKPIGMTGVQIINIDIDGDQIPKSTYVFPRENGEFPTDYEYPTSTDHPDAEDGYVTIFPGTKTAPLLSDTQIAPYENPEDLKSTSNKVFSDDSDSDKSYYGKAPLGETTATTMNAQEYNDLLDNYTRNSKYVYLRESGKPIKGRITYSLDGGTTTKTADFFMKPPTGSNPENPYDYPNTTNFYRNHSWTVYGYFKGGSLYVIPYVLPWTVASEISYESKIGYNLAPQESYRRRLDVDSQSGAILEGETSQWGVISISSGYIRTTYEGDEPVETIFYDNPTENDRPAKAHRIILKTKTAGEDLQLNMDNPNFRFVVYDGSTQKYNYSLVPGASLRITGTPAEDGYITTYFYLVPASTLPSDAPDYEKICHVSLSTTSTSIGAMRLPFNSSALPGASEASDEIAFFYTSPDVYFNKGEVVTVE